MNIAIYPDVPILGRMHIWCQLAQGRERSIKIVYVFSFKLQ